MPIKIIDGDLFCTSAMYICHQVNCKGRMGRGVAKQIKTRFPWAYTAYADRCHKFGDQNLGHAQVVVDGKKHPDSQEKEIRIVNLFAQKSYGHDGKCYTDYEAFQSAMEELERGLHQGDRIAMPYLIGCGLGGGNWSRVLKIIEGTVAKNHIVELWKLGEPCTQTQK